MKRKTISTKNLAKLTAGIATGETAVGIVLGHPELGLLALPFGAMAVGDFLGGLSKAQIKKALGKLKVI
jgi:hypothetical protein